ncbi:MAG: LacI family DNA-binding transcriptional regulator [Lachnospiraceae bacterium]|nr:LacI family DNA-binding transcriptional regulator [Lachnospiraceae bacterium]
MATIREIAKIAGVSAGAVSRILNNDPSMSVSDSTREKVLKTAEDLGYTKKEKKYISGNTSFSLGIVQWFTLEEELADPYYLMVRRGIEDYCSKNNISIVRFFPSDYSALSSSDALSEMSGQLRKTDGLVCVGKFSEKEMKSFLEICSNTVFLDMDSKKLPVSSVTMDFENAVKESLDHLCSAGHKKIAYLGGREYVGDHEAISDPREKSFVNYMKEKKIEYKKYLRTGEFTSSSGYEMMNSLFNDKAVPSAVFAASDAIAIGAMRSVVEHGLKIPKDISFIGFNDLDACKYTTPSLTSVHAPAYEMGAIGANLAYTASLLQAAVPLKIKIPCELIIRESCSSPE